MSARRAGRSWYHTSRMLAALTAKRSGGASRSALVTRSSSGVSRPRASGATASTGTSSTSDDGTRVSAPSVDGVARMVGCRCEASGCTTRPPASTVAPRTSERASYSARPPMRMPRVSSGAEYTSAPLHSERTEASGTTTNTTWSARATFSPATICRVNARSSTPDTRQAASARATVALSPLAASTSGAP